MKCYLVSKKDTSLVLSPQASSRLRATRSARRARHESSLRSQLLRPINQQLTGSIIRRRAKVLVLHHLAATEAALDDVRNWQSTNVHAGPASVAFRRPSIAQMLPKSRPGCG